MRDVDDRSDPLDRRHADVPMVDRRADGRTEGCIADLEGTLPLRPFTDRFYGTVAADLATTRVAALVCDAQGAIILLSLVGPDIACAAVLARVFAGQMIHYQPGGAFVAQTEPRTAPPCADQGAVAAPRDGAAEVAEVNASSPDDRWDGPTELRRPACLMKQFQTPLAGTRERHYLALAATADLREVGHLAQRADPLSEVPASATSATSATLRTSAEGAIPDRGRVSPSAGRAASRGAVSAAERGEPPLPQYVLGNATEATPAPEMVLGHVRALRLPIVPQWTSLLWAQGQASGLITPALARGVRAWRLDTDRTCWTELLTSGVRAGWLTVP